MQTPDYEIDDRTFRHFARMIHEKCGIVITDKKRAMLQARLSKRMRKLGVASFRDYHRLVEQDASGAELVSLLDAVSTNVTHFFREKAHFHFLAQQLVAWQQQGASRFRIWCAAASTGEEPYSIAMIMSEYLPDLRDAKLLATDISTHVLQKAREARYKADKMTHVETPLLQKYFTTQNTADGLLYEAKSSIARLVAFRRLNLAVFPYPLKGPLDVVFCRNVMIYFDNPLRIKMLQEFERLIRPGGLLFVGHAESLTGTLTTGFISVQPAIYRRTGV